MEKDTNLGLTRQMKSMDADWIMGAMGREVSRLVIMHEPHLSLCLRAGHHKIHAKTRQSSG